MAATVFHVRCGEIARSQWPFAIAPVLGALMMGYILKQARADEPSRGETVYFQRVAPLEKELEDVSSNLRSLTRGKGFHERIQKISADASREREALANFGPVPSSCSGVHSQLVKWANVLCVTAANAERRTGKELETIQQGVADADRIYRHLELDAVTMER